MQPSFSALISTVYGQVLGFCFQALGDAALASQASTQVCLRWARSPHADETIWQLAVAVVREHVLRGFVVEPLAPEGQQSDLLRAIQKLDVEHRMAVLLRYHERLEISTVAQAMKLDERRVRTMIADARHGMIARTEE
ncbi:MAG: hypothetical protein NVS4B8_02260 [Herpetosiphon sp.]